jgi:hypothetical protein
MTTTAPITATVYFGGSRSLPPSAFPLVCSVVSSVLALGASVSVGCAIGADAQVIRAAFRFSSFPRVTIRAAFDASGFGSWRCSAVDLVRFAASCGVPVIWASPSLLRARLVARLMARSRAGLVGCSVAVFFAPGPGSLAVARAAVDRHIPVYAFSPFAPSAPRGCVGSWSPATFAALACWLWSPAQLVLPAD